MNAGRCLVDVIAVKRFVVVNNRLGRCRNYPWACDPREVALKVICSINFWFYSETSSKIVD